MDAKTNLNKLSAIMEKTYKRFIKHININANL